METLTQKQFEEKYGEGFAIFLEKDIEKFDNEIQKAIQVNPGFEKDILEQSNIQKLELDEVHVICKGKRVRAFVRELPPSPDYESFQKQKNIINKALEGSMIDIDKAEDLILKARKKYNVGDISDATGLQKQTDGSWKPPKGGGKGKKEDESGSKGKKKEDEKSGGKKKEDESGEKYFGPESENNVQKFKDDLKSGKITREKAIMELKGIGMDDEKVSNIVDKLAPKKDDSSDDSEKNSKKANDDSDGDGDSGDNDSLDENEKKLKEKADKKVKEIKEKSEDLSRRMEQDNNINYYVEVEKFNRDDGSITQYGLTQVTDKEVEDMVKFQIDDMIDDIRVYDFNHLDKKLKQENYVHDRLAFKLSEIAVDKVLNEKYHEVDIPETPDIPDEVFKRVAPFVDEAYNKAKNAVETARSKDKLKKEKFISDLTHDFTSNERKLKTRVGQVVGAYDRYEGIKGISDIKKIYKDASKHIFGDNKVPKDVDTYVKNYISESAYKKGTFDDPEIVEDTYKDNFMTDDLAIKSLRKIGYTKKEAEMQLEEWKKPEFHDDLKKLVSDMQVNNESLRDEAFDEALDNLESDNPDYGFIRKLIDDFQSNQPKALRTESIQNMMEKIEEYQNK